MLRSLFVSALILVSLTFNATAETVSIELEPYNVTSTRIGQLDFYRTYQYSFKSSGNIKALNVDVGDSFKKGQLLASVDTDTLNSELNALLAEKAYVNQEVRRLSKLRKQNAVSESELEKYKSQSSQLKAGITRVREFLAASTVVAPYDGVVIKRSADLGEWAAPGQMILEVAPLNNNLVVEVGVKEDELENLSVGTELTVTSTASQRSFVGEVRTISKTPNLMTGLFEIQVAVQPEGRFTIGKLYSVNVLGDSVFVFKVPSHLATIDFNHTAIVKIQDAQSKIRPKRFSVVGLDSEFVYLAGDKQSSIDVVKE